MYSVVKNFDLKEFINRFRFMKKPVLIMSGIYLLGISAILRANFNYKDDIVRASDGHKGWEDYYRYTSNFLSSFIHADNYLTDVSPLPQLIAVLILALTGVIILYIVTSEKKFNMWHLISLVPIGLSPYFLENMSYKYDAPYMALSILAMIAPLLFKEKNLYLYVITVAIGTIVMSTTYQASAGIFPMFVVLIATRKWNEGKSIKEIFRFILKSVAGYGIGSIIFKCFIERPVSSYVNNKIVLTKFAYNFNKYISLVRSDFNRSWKILISLVAIGYIYVTIRDSKRRPLFSLCWSSHSAYIQFWRNRFSDRGECMHSVYLYLFWL